MKKTNKKFKIELPDNMDFLSVRSINLSESKRVIWVELELLQGFEDGEILVSMGYNSKTNKKDIPCPFILKRDKGTYSFYAGISYLGDLMINELPLDSPNQAIWTLHPELCRKATNKEKKLLLDTLLKEKGLIWDPKLKQLIKK